jgi:hypothetical protein
LKIHILTFLHPLCACPARKRQVKSKVNVYQKMPNVNPGSLAVDACTHPHRNILATGQVSKKRRNVFCEEDSNQQSRIKKRITTRLSSWEALPSISTYFCPDTTTFRGDLQQTRTKKS